MAAVDAYQARSGQSVFVEYVMLGPDVNCTPTHAHQLGALLRGRNVLVNLIPWWAARRRPRRVPQRQPAALQGVPLQESPAARPYDKH